MKFTEFFISLVDKTTTLAQLELILKEIALYRKYNWKKEKQLLCFILMQMVGNFCNSLYTVTFLDKTIHHL